MLAGLEMEHGPSSEPMRHHPRFDFVAFDKLVSLALEDVVEPKLIPEKPEIS